MAIQNGTRLPESPNKAGKRVVLFPAPMQGHMSPMLHLANLLHTRGFAITIIHTNFNAPNVSKYPQFTFRAIDDGLPEEITNSVPNIVDLPILVHNVIEPFRDIFAEVLAESAGETVPCLIADALWAYTSVVKEKFTIPFLVLWTESMATSLVEDALPVFREKGYFDLSGQESKLEEPVPEYPMLKFKDIDNILHHHPDELYAIMTNMVNEMKGANGIIWNACKELEHTEIPKINKNFPQKNFLVGPIHMFSPSFSSSIVAQDPTVIPWLDSQPANSVVYVSFGSMPHIGEAEFLEMAWGLANSNRHFLWVVRPKSVNGTEWIELLPEGFLENLGGRGHIVKWTPQLDVLSHPATSVFLTHNGWNSTVEAISEGVPMICSLGVLDQPINSRYASGVWKVGVGLENIKRDEIKRAIERLMDDKEGQEIRERITELKETVNQCIQKGGSSHLEVESLVDYISSLADAAADKPNGSINC